VSVIPDPFLVTVATGYVGGRLIPALLAAAIGCVPWDATWKKWAAGLGPDTAGLSWFKGMSWTLNFSNRQLAGAGWPIIWLIP